MEPREARSRREWMAVLARTPRDALKHALDAALDGATVPGYEWLRAPDIGLAMVRGRIGGTGDAFNLGETTVTRATLRLRTDDGSAPVGIAVHMGRDKERATIAALADALLQMPRFADMLQKRLVEPLAARIADERRRKETQAAATKVEFFTMVRGE
ncbi:phosphonate metabolism PhnG protein [Caballeronia fortuita]|uniref:Phosphonate metabolism PhnG protein n=2 Tax=Caballeronia fortuita TaxID=1777138 RepID=A0A158BIN9_9BURK|nr:phosphonate metabolism PhnG protein [Caballeronia fortuita]